MDKTVLAEVLAVVLAGSIMTLLFPDGKYKNLLKMLSGFAVAVGIISLFSGFSFSLPEFSEYAPENRLSTTEIISTLAENDAEKIVSEYADNFEIGVSVVFLNDTYYVEKITVYTENCENEEAMTLQLREEFGLPPLGVSVIKKEMSE